MKIKNNYSTKAMSLLLAIVMLLGMLPMSVFAAETEVEKEYNYAILYTDGTLKITHNNFSSLLYIAWSEDAEKIKKVEFADDLNITAIPKQAFQHCVNLTEITIPDSVTSIGERAFSECISLKNITIPENVTVIDKFAFNRCETLVSISIPDGVESISNGAFNQCYALTTVIIPDSVTSIGDGAFSNCHALASITIPASVTSIGYAFNGCGKLTDIYYDGTVESWNSITKGAGAIPDGVTIHTTAPDLIITGGTAGTDYTYENGVLDIKAAGTYEIKNADPATATGDIIKVSAPSGTVNIILSGVVINVSATDLAAFEITGECTTKLILKDGSENSLDSGVDRAGIANHSHNLIITCENAENATHICSSDCGVLRAIGQYYGAGIGGDSDESGSNIIITGGNIVADIVNSQGGAGIGGGVNGNGSNITISGGTVTATGGGAGIGGGNGGNGSNITISGGTVTATSENGAGIGGGWFGSGSGITISGGTVTATSEQGAGIGGGADGGIAGNIKIAPAANTEIMVNTGANVSEAEELTFSFKEETDVTTLVSQNAYFYSEANCIHADTDKDHKCDFCGETMGTHGDTNLDHTCDYGCADSIGTHKDSDTDADHVCDYGCGATLENCTDAENDNNHSCDVCGKADASTHTYGNATCEAPATCSECGGETGDALGHKDDNTDHNCDRGCGKTDVGIHDDANLDHACDYGCAVAFGTCDDADKDHDCDYGCTKTFGTHAAATGKHTCDYCSAAVSNCKDDDGNHICDICGAELTHDYSTEWKSDGTNHWHECSCGAKADEAAHNGGTASCTDKAKCVVCAVEYGELAAHTYGTEWKSDGTNHWHECSCGAKADEAAHNGGTASCTDKAKCVVCAVEYGELAAHTYEKGKCTVCEAVDPDYVPETDTPPTGDNSHMALWIALLFISGGAVITLTAYDRKRRI